LKESDTFMEELLKRMNQLRTNIDLLKKSKIPDRDVTIQTVRSKDIKSILHKIAVFEREFT